MSDSTFERIVPSFEMCSRIPEGRFADSCLVWIASGRTGSRGVIQRRPALPDWVEAYPAPTLQEIMEDLWRNERGEVDAVLGDEGHEIYLRREDGYELDSTGDSLVEAVLSLWLDHAN